MNCRRLCHVLALLCSISSNRARAAEPDPKDAIWIEGEAPARQAMARHPWWYDQVKKDVLSGGDWISNYSKEKEGTAEYAFSVTTPDTYAFWVRANSSVEAKLTWKLDGGEWTPVDFKSARGQQNIAADNKPDMRFIAWVKAADVKLTAGPHTIAFKMHSGADKQHHGGLDCFVFTRIPFVPAGAQKPSATRAAGAPDEWFPLLADDDTFSPASVIDMSALIPAPAGQFGFLKAVGSRLKFEGAETRVKLWGVGANLETGKYTRTQLTQRARYLRKFGVNAVRQHPLWDEVTTDGQLDPAKLDAYDWWFAELKKHGLYTCWSVFYHWTIGPDAGYALYDDLGPGERRDTYGVIAGAPALWELRNRVLVQLLEHKNPHTGLRYADDPALACVEMNNEESIFFWNPLSELASPAPKKWPRHAQQLRERFAAWIKELYQTDEALAAAWGQLRHGDSVAARELKLMTPWEVDGDGIRGLFAGQTARAGDVVRFLAEMQRANFERCEEAIRGTGFRAITMTTAWLAASGPMDPANTWTDTVGSMIDRHDYFGGGDGKHGIAEGGVKWVSHLARPGMGLFGQNLRVVETKPFCLTEWTQSPPNRWKHEAAPLMAFYALGLQGWDASFHFAQSGTRLGDGWPRMTAYASDTPHYLGQFPALAFALHRGHLAEAPVVAARQLAIDEIFSGKDPLRPLATPAETFAIGRVTLGFDREKSVARDLAEYWDKDGQLIRSATGELEWDYGRERVLVRSPKTQAIIGRPGEAPVSLPGVNAAVKTDFVSLIFTPLDDLPLAQSRQILITALAQDKQTGARYNADGTRLDAVGTAPLLLEPVQATLRFAGAKPTRVTPCDHYGVPFPGQAVPIAPGGSVTIDGRYRAYYYEVRR